MRPGNVTTITDTGSANSAQIWRESLEPPYTSTTQRDDVRARKTTVDGIVHQDSVTTFDALGRTATIVDTATTAYSMANAPAR